MAFNNGRSQLNVGQDSDYPFINIVKTAGVWLQRSPFAQINLDDYQLDSNGYPTIAAHSGLYFVPIRLPTQAEKPGDWVATWDGGGTIILNQSGSGSLTTVSGSKTNAGPGGSGRFVFTPSSDVTDIEIGISAVNSPSDYITNLQVFHVNDEALLNAGEIFNPDYITKLRQLNPGVLRFLNWNAQRGPSTWSTRKSQTYYTWLGQEVRQSVWAGIPTLSGSAYSCTLSGFSLVDKAIVQLQWGTVGATSGTYTLNVGGTGTKQLKGPDGAALSSGANTYPNSGYSGVFVYDANLDCWLSLGGNLQFFTTGIDNGVPYEVCISLCEKIGAHPWFTLPYLACDPPTDWVPSLVSLISSLAPSWMRVFFEPTNETWNFNFNFPQTMYANNKAVFHWGAGNDYNEWYGMVLSNLGQDVSSGFSRGSVVCGVQTSLGSWSNSRLTSAKYVTVGPTFGGYTRQAAYLTTTHVCGANYYNPADYNTGTETTLVANWVSAGHPSYAADTNNYLRTYVETSLTGGSFTIDQVESKFSALKTFAQTNNVSKLCCYEGGYSPDYTGSPVGSSDADKFRAASKQAHGLYDYTLSLYNYILSLSGAGFIAEFPSCFMMCGPATSIYAWAILEDLYQSSALTPQFQAIVNFNTTSNVAFAKVTRSMPSLSYPAGRTPGLDPTHVAGRISTGIFLSAISLSGQLASLSGKSWLSHGSVPYSGVDAYLGRVTSQDGAFSDLAVSNTALPGFATVWNKGTMACIIRQHVQALVTPFLTDSTVNNEGTALTIAAGNLNFRKNHATNIASTIPLATGAPLFIAASWDDTIGINFVLTRLDTGQTYSQTVADTTAVTVTSDGIPNVITNSTNRRDVAALAFNNQTNLTLQELQQWAADPWSFWYPQSFKTYVVSVPGGGFIYARPDADSIDGGWLNELGTNTNLFASIDEGVADDADYIASSTTVGDLVKLGLSNVSGVSNPTTVRYRYKKRGSGDPASINLLAALLEGSTTIAQWQHNDIGTSYILAEQSLTTGQFNAISDLTNLFLQFQTTWWLTDASIDLDFSNARYYDSSDPTVAVTDFLSCSRASIGYAKNLDGTLTSFANDTLRIGVGTGLLVEDARTNLLLRSTEFNISDWVKVNSSISSDATTDPAGGTAADKLVEASDTNQVHYIQQDLVKAASSFTYSFSIYAKAAGRGRIVITVDETTDANGYYAIYDLVGAQVGVTGANFGSGFVFSSASVEPMANGWCRCIIIGSSTTSTNLRCRAALDRGSGTAAIDQSYNGDGTSGVYLWGAQLEQAPFASSFIPTTTTSATRAADNITIIGNAQTDIAAAAASIVAQLNSGSLAGIAANVVDSNGTNLLGFNSSNNALASITATLATSNTANRTTQDKLGLTWDGSGRSLVLNNGTVATDATAQTPSSTQHLGWNGTANSIYAYVERLTIWTSKIADATLQGFTAP